MISFKKKTTDAPHWPQLTHGVKTQSGILHRKAIDPTSTSPYQTLIPKPGNLYTLTHHFPPKHANMMDRQAPNYGM